MRAAPVRSGAANSQARVQARVGMSALVGFIKGAPSHPGIGGLVNFLGATLLTASLPPVHFVLDPACRSYDSLKCLIGLSFLQQSALQLERFEGNLWRHNFAPHCWNSPLHIVYGTVSQRTAPGFDRRDPRMVLLSMPRN
jgi:hypothetical protein